MRVQRWMNSNLKFVFPYETLAQDRVEIPFNLER